MKNILEMIDISKVYPNGVYANKKVNFSVREGEIHALVGENGAGKTTLMKVMFGIEQPDNGEIRIGGERVSFASANDAIQKGICMVHQHFMLVPSLTVAENTALGCEDTKGLFIDKDAVVKKVTEISEKYNLKLNPNDLVADISVGMKQRVEILKTLYRGAKIIILDEPTAVLTPQETEELFIQLKVLREKGHTIIFISHKLHEIKQITDRISILRKGELVATVDTSGVTEKEISDLMIGENINLQIEKGPAHPGKAVLDIENLTTRDDSGKTIFENLCLKVREGQILGLAGVEGNGQKELIEIITSQRKYDSGTVAFGGKPVRFGRIIESRNRGMGYVPADRMTMGAAVEFSVEENLVANEIRTKRLSDGVLTSPKKIDDFAEKLVEEYGITCSSPKTPVKMLSGGNIQKVVAAREFSGNLKLIVADQPTRGIDVLAADFIHKTLVKLRDSGAAVLLSSADLDELLKVSDSVIVMYGGKIVAYFEDASNISQMELGNYMLGALRMEDSVIRSEYYEK